MSSPLGSASIGVLSIVCGAALGCLCFLPEEKRVRQIYDERRKAAVAIALLLAGLGFVELLLPEGIPILVVRCGIALTSFGLAWVIKAGVVQSAAMLMAILVLIRAALLHLGINP